MFGDIFVEIYKFMMILYIIYRVFVFFQLNYFELIKFEKIFYKKWKLANLFILEKHGKLAHLQNLAPKIFHCYEKPRHRTKSSLTILLLLIHLQVSIHFSSYVHIHRKF